MILADSSVWINYFRGKEPRLAELLLHEEVAIHVDVIGELALGSLKNRSLVLHDLQMLPHVTPTNDRETLEWIERRQIFGKGIGWTDARLLLSCVLSNTGLWTTEKPLSAVARLCGVKLFSAPPATDLASEIRQP